MKRRKLVWVFPLDLGCFLSFRVIDLGVMVPCDKILREAVSQKAGTVYSLDCMLSVWDADDECIYLCWANPIFAQLPKSKIQRSCELIKMPLLSKRLFCRAHWVVDMCQMCGGDSLSRFSLFWLLIIASLSGRLGPYFLWSIITSSPVMVPSFMALARSSSRQMEWRQ